MTLLVVGNHQSVDVTLIPFDKIDGVLLVHCVEGGVFELKHKLQVQCRIHNIPLKVMFAIPPVDVVPVELLMGFGLTRSTEVILYDDKRINPVQPGHDTES